jgi:hypothetical protein
MQFRSKNYEKFYKKAKDRFSFIVGMGQRACSFSLAASGLDVDSIFGKARELGFPVQDEKLRAFLKSLKE